MLLVQLRTVFERGEKFGQNPNKLFFFGLRKSANFFFFFMKRGDKVGAQPLAFISECDHLDTTVFVRLAAFNYAGGMHPLDNAGDVRGVTR